MNKNYLGLLLIILLIFATIPGYSYNGVTVFVEGNELELTQDPAIINGKPVVPLWDVLKAMGFELEWKNDMKAIEGTKGETKVEFFIGSKTSKVNGEKITLDRPVLNRNNIPMLSIDFIEEGLLGRTEWNYNYRKLSISSTNELKVHFIDVEDGEAIFVEYYDSNILIDTGTEKSSEIIVDYIKNLDVEGIKYLVLTHKDIEHIGGLKDIANNFKIENIIRPNNFHDDNWVEDFIKQPKLGSSIRIMEAQDMSFDLGYGVKFDVIETGDDYEDEGNNCVATMLQHNNIKILFTGDMEGEVEERNLEKFDNIDILKVANSGRNSSTTEAFLNIVDPEASVICSHTQIDSTEVTERLLEKEIKVYNTASLGTIIVTTNGKNYEITNNPITGIEILGIDFVESSIMLNNLTEKEFDMSNCIVTDKKGELVFRIVEGSVLKPDTFMVFDLVFDEENSTKDRPINTSDYPLESHRGVLFDTNWNIISH